MPDLSVGKTLISWTFCGQVMEQNLADLHQRQSNFVERLREDNVSHALISDPRHVYYFSGFLTHKPKFSSFLLIDCDSSNFTLFLGRLLKFH